MKKKALLTVIALLIFLSTSVYAYTPLVEYPAGYFGSEVAIYYFNETDADNTSIDAIDSSGNGYTGTSYLNTYVSPYFKGLGNAYNDTNANYTIITNPFTSSNVSICFDFVLTTLNQAYILRTNDHRIGTASGHLRIWDDGIGSWIYCDESEYYTTLNLSNPTNVSACWTFGGGSANCYTQSSKYNYAIKHNVGTITPFGVGTILEGIGTDSAGAFWNGIIDNLLIFEETLTDEDIFIILNGYYYLPSITNINFYNITEEGTNNFTRILNYNVTIQNYGYDSYLNIFINGILNNSIFVENAVYGNPATIDTQIIKPGSEGAFNISFDIQSVFFNYTTHYNNYTFIADLENPEVTYIDISISTQFNSTEANINVTCTDNIFTPLTYNITLNNNSVFYGNNTNNTLQTNKSETVTGLNTLKANCIDPFGTSDIETATTSAYTHTIIIIDEIENIPFNLANCTSAKVYQDDNSTLIDFKAANVTNITFSTFNSTSLRFVFGYENNVIITRYIDLSILDESPLRICINKEGVTHYEQLILSASQQKVKLYSIYANCLIAADYTKFAYQDAYVLKAYTIDNRYFLHTYDNNDNEITLANIDGSISSYINIDTLEFQREGYNFNILDDSLTFSKTAATQLGIYYINLNEDNTDINITITRTDTGAVVYTDTSISDPNEFTIYFDYSTLTNVTNNTLFKITATKTNSDGTIQQIKRYFNLDGKAGIISSGMAVAISLLLVVFGFTFTISRVTFSWFGIFIILAAMAVLALAISAWYILFFEAIYAIVLVYTFMVMINLNYNTVS